MWLSPQSFGLGPIGGRHAVGGADRAVIGVQQGLGERCIGWNRGAANGRRVREEAVDGRGQLPSGGIDAGRGDQTGRAG